MSISKSIAEDTKSLARDALFGPDERLVVMPSASPYGDESEVYASTEDK